MFFVILPKVSWSCLWRGCTNTLLIFNSAIVFLGGKTDHKMPRLKVLPVGKGHEAQTESSPKMPRTKNLYSGKCHVASQNESGPPTIMELFRTLNQKFEEVNMLLVRTGNKLDDMVKEIRNNNQRRAGLLQQLQAQQPSLTVKTDVLGDKKTRESREDFAPDGRLGDLGTLCSPRCFLVIL